MRCLNGDQCLMRVFVGESDRHDGRPLYQVLFDLFRSHGIASVTVLHGILGYGAMSHLNAASISSRNQDLPIVLEAVDTKEHIEQVVPLIEEYMEDGLIMFETVKVIRYGAAAKTVVDSTTVSS